MDRARQFTTHQANECREAEPARRVGEAPGGTRSLTIIVFSGEMDKLQAAFTLAIGAAAMCSNVSMFFTLWGLIALKRHTLFKGKTLSGRLLTAVLPSGPERAPTSRLNMLGLGPLFFRFRMRSRGIERVCDLITTARAMGVRLCACEASMEVMGISKEELLDDLQYGGVATCLDAAFEHNATLFI